MNSRPVTDAVMRRVADAISRLASSSDLRPTKRSLEGLSELSHDAVARAFRQDLEAGSPWNLTERFAALTAGGPKRSADERAIHDVRQQLAEERERRRSLELALNQYAQVILAQQLELDVLRESQVTVVPLRSRR